MFVGSFEPDDFFGFQTDVQSSFADFQSKGVTQLIVDLTNNGGRHTSGPVVNENMGSCTHRWICLSRPVPSCVPRRHEEPWHFPKPVSICSTFAGSTEPTLYDAVASNRRCARILLHRRLSLRILPWASTTTSRSIPRITVRFLSVSPHIDDE